MILMLILAGCSSGIVSVGKETFMVSRRSAQAGFGPPLGAKADTYAEANTYCSLQNKIVKTVALNMTDSGFAKPGAVELTFKCIGENEADIVNENSTVMKAEVIPVKILGYSHNTTVKNIKLDSQWAMLDAKIKAIEKAGVKIESTTVVNNYEFLSDVVESKAKGVLLPGFEFVEFGYDENGVYKVLLIGSVQGIKSPR